MNLYGNDMDESTQRRWSRAWRGPWPSSRPTRDFIGREALEARARRVRARKLVGLLLEDRGVLRGHQKVLTRGAATARSPAAPSRRRWSARSRSRACRRRAPATTVQVDIRGKLLNARVVKPPFVR